MVKIAVLCSFYSDKFIMQSIMAPPPLWEISKFGFLVSLFYPNMANVLIMNCSKIALEKFELDLRKLLLRSNKIL
jgi:hypothetical protein